MRRLTVLLASALAFAIPASASAATPSTVLKSQLRAQKAKVVKLKIQLASAKATISTLNGQIVTLTGSFAQAQTDLATRTTERDAANASIATANTNLAYQVTLTNQAAAGFVAGMSPDQLWGLLGVIYPLLPNSDLCGYSRSFYSSGNYTSYTFTRYVC
jgi:peptidoglycan hydrolase CwlO-like protein